MAKPSNDYLEPYRRAVAVHGASFEATLWRSPQAQQVRFDLMIDLVELDHTTLLDVGCGKGDFAARLCERGIHYEKYIGLDALPEMIEAASIRALPRATFQTRDVLSDPACMAEAGADYVCVSGTLNTMEQPVARELISAAFDAAAQGVVFNFLSDRAHSRWKEKDLHPARRFDTLDWLDWALSRTPRVAFAQHYLDGHDATILMLRS